MAAAGDSAGAAADKMAGLKLSSSSSPPTFEDLAAQLGKGGFKRIVVMCGAGLSCAAGIPDFRSKGGVYDMLASDKDFAGLPAPESIFTLDYFKQNPRPFTMFAKKLLPGSYLPTVAHSFIAMLEKKGILLRCYSQNIDGLELLAGVSPDKLVQAHGGFDGARCLTCGTAHTTEYVRERILRDEICRCKCDGCDGLVKPNIVFFGESLPRRFAQLSRQDLPAADLLIVMGTSLTVYPFAGLVHDVKDSTPRLLINREAVGMAGSGGSSTNAFLAMLMGGVRGGDRGFLFGTKDNVRDVFKKGDCDDGVRDMCKLAGLEKDLANAVAATKSRFTDEQKVNEGGGVKKARDAAGEKEKGSQPGVGEENASSPAAVKPAAARAAAYDEETEEAIAQA